MTLKKFILPILLLMCHYLSAQSDTIALTEVIISDTQLRDFSDSQSVQKLNDSVIGRNAASLTSLLNYNTNIYFKENGLGMVSSPSFRGTTASQTAVVWNGININSQLNGQTDFNVLNTRDFNNISVRAGGGSVAYGSSAIGGSIHLNNDLAFGNRFDNSLRTDYGNYKTIGINYRVDAATDDFSTNASISRNSSDNDYGYPGTNKTNENGQYYNTSLNVGMAYKLNPKNIIRFYSYLFDGERHFSGTLAAPSRSKYQSIDARNLVEWSGYYGKFTSRLKGAYLYEKYKYFENYKNDIYSFGNIKTYIARYDLTYDVSEAIKLNTILDYTHNNGEGSDIINKKRDIGSASLLMKHALTNRLRYELGVRKELTESYESPVLFSAGTEIDVTGFYTIRLNASRNFRIPTYNDLYWTGSGNPDLKPESSYQGEIGNVLKFKGFMLSVTGYYIDMTNMLRWTPGTNGIWSPGNVGKAKSYGVESLLNWNKKIGAGHISITGTYAYTISREDGSDDQLIYVPLHKATASLAYSYKRASVYYRHLFNGEVFTTADNSYSLDPYNVGSVGAEYTFKVLKGIDVGVQVNNLWDQEYLAYEVRPMPGRNYNMYLNFNF
ncbi:TonB-dependent receptor plug domain-containing protein [Flavobacterium hauense]